MASDDLRARLARIRADAERNVHPSWRDVNPTWVLLNELDRLTAELETPTASSGRCPRCLCSDCGGRRDEHTETSCGCEACEPSPFLGPMACSLAEFAPDERIGFIAEQLGPLLSSHLNERARVRCLAVAHAAHHALYDYDTKERSS